MTIRVRALLALLLVSTVAAQGKNLLFYGNSFTYYSWGYGVPELVREIAIAAGQPAPTITAALVGGVTLQYHATDPGQIAVISTALPPGQTWDAVVIQGHQLEATPEGGHDPMVFRANAATILGNVRAHSPAATAVMFQTWASAWGHIYYPVPWAVPLDMHEVVRTNYHLAVGDLEAAFGPGAACNAAAGDAVALLQFDPAWYEADLAHPNPAVILLTAMTIYTAIYRQAVCEVQPAFAPPGSLAQLLATKNLGAADWDFLSGLADRCADPALRRLPGSGDQLLLENATDAAPLTARPRLAMTLGTLVRVQLRSLNGVHDGATGWLLVDLCPTGTPPGPDPVFPELRLRAGSMALLTASPTLASPLAFAVPMPLSLPGTSILVQGLSWHPSAASGNPWFTTTDAHELVFY